MWDKNDTTVKVAMNTLSINTFITNTTSSEVLLLNSRPKEILTASGSGYYYKLLGVDLVIIVTTQLVGGSGNLVIYYDDYNFPIYSIPVSTIAALTSGTYYISLTSSSGRFKPNTSVNMRIGGDFSSGDATIDVYTTYIRRLI